MYAQVFQRFNVPVQNLPVKAPPAMLNGRPTAKKAPPPPPRPPPPPKGPALSPQGPAPSPQGAAPSPQGAAPSPQGAPPQVGITLQPGSEGVPQAAAELPRPPQPEAGTAAQNLSPAPQLHADATPLINVNIVVPPAPPPLWNPWGAYRPKHSQHTPPPGAPPAQVAGVSQMAQHTTQQFWDPVRMRWVRLSTRAYWQEERATDGAWERRHQGRAVRHHEQVDAGWQPRPGAPSGAALVSQECSAPGCTNHFRFSCQRQDGRMCRRCCLQQADGGCQNHRDEL